MPETTDLVAADPIVRMAARGWRVVPLHSIIADSTCSCRRGRNCGSAGKHPRSRNGVKDATADAGRITEWAEKWPGCNWGVATGRVSNLLVLDVDPRHGGDQTMVAITRRLGALPITPRVRTGGDGSHLYFAHPAVEAKFRRQLGDGVDIQGNGRYVVAAGSRHVSGRRYAWEVTPDDTPPAELPEPWLQYVLGMIPDPPPGYGGSVTTKNATRTIHVSRGGPDSQVGEAIQETLPSGPGGRNRCLIRFVDRLRRIPQLKGQPASVIREHVAAWHRRALPSIDTEEFSITWHEARWLWEHTDPTKQTFQNIVAVAMDDEAPTWASKYDVATVRLILLCRRLQEHHGANPFYLPYRLAADVAGLKRMAALRRMRRLQADGIIELVRVGDRSRANEWRYVGASDKVSRGES